MSYVVQNFYDPFNLIFSNRRTKFFFKCRNIFFILSFYKFFFSAFLSYFPSLNSNFILLNTFTKANFAPKLFAFQKIFFIRKNEKFLTKSHRFYSFFLLRCFFSFFFKSTTFSPLPSFFCPRFSLIFSFNSVFFSVMKLFLFFNLKTFKPYFFYFLVFNNFIWPSYSQFFNFSKLLFSLSEFQFFFFANKRFFKIFKI